MNRIPIKPNLLKLFLYCIFSCTCCISFSQTRVIEPTATLPAGFLDAVNNKASRLSEKLGAHAEKLLNQLQKDERRLKRKLSKIDSSKAEELFGHITQQYKTTEQRLQNNLSRKNYIPTLDTLGTSLKFLEQNREWIPLIKNGEQKLTSALGNVNDLGARFQQAEELRKFLQVRKQLLGEQLKRFGFTRELKKLNKQAYYYSEQLREYKSLLNDSRKAEQKAIELLSHTKPFREFMRKNSMLASLFGLPAEPGNALTQAGLPGLQTRTQVNALILQQVATGGPNAQAQLQQQLQYAQSQLNGIKNKLNQIGQGSRDTEMPGGFKPNSQKTKSFRERFEYGTSIQTQKATNYFPVTSDIGLTLGYKLNDKSIIGAGVSYKLGWGSSWNNIRITNQGVGLRSFIDYKIKGSLWISGGYEQNYKTAFNSVGQLKDISAWQQSGLIGASKVISLKTKFFKKTKLQLLWDFLSYRQVPETQPLLFRIGYTF